MSKCFKHLFILCVAVVFTLWQATSFSDQLNNPDDGGESLEIISPNSIQTQPSAQKVTVSKSQLISLDYTNADLTDVLKAISYSYNINIIITKDLKGKISAKLKDFSLEDALNAILGIHNYGFMKKGGIFYIVPKEDLDQVTETIPLSFLSLKEAQTLLKGALSTGALIKGSTLTFSGNIQQNEDANTLVVTATPSDMEKIKIYLKGIDVPPLQVMIDAEIVSLSKNDSKNIGSTINVNYNPANGLGLSVLSGDGASTNTSGSNSSTNNSGTNSTTTGSTPTVGSTATTGTTSTVGGLSNAVQGIGSGADSGIFGMSGSWRNFSPSIAINALVSQNKARVIASPSIATLNGHEASILIGEQYPYTTTTTTTGGSGSVGAIQQTQTQYIDIGTKLKVTPIVSPDGWITLKVDPEVSSFSGTSAGGNPIITTSTADTEVRVRDNQTIVIGGLDSRNVNDTKSGTPGLMSIPLLGWLFHHDTTTVDDGTLTVLITPHIVLMPDNNKKASENTSFSKGDDSSVIQGLLDYAQALELDKTKDTSQNLYISEEQIKTYRKILEQFPQSGRTDYCLYRIAFIYGKDFGNCVAAKESLTEMKDFFPNSPYGRVTELFVNACTAVGEAKDKQ